jgi:uncharacterized protein (TIGR03437 family)
MRFLPILLLIAPAFGQFTGLATNYDGSRLYFSSSLQMAGSTDENAYPKIFYYDGTSLHLYAQRSPSESADYQLEFPYVSTHGSVVGYQAIGLCTAFDASCGYLFPTVTVLYYPGSISPSTLRWACQISGNAQYALCQTGSPGPGAQVTLIDIATGATAKFENSCLLGSSNQVASNGTSLQVTSGHLTGLAGTSGTIESLFYDNIACPLISDDGSTVVTPSVTLNVASGKQTTLSTSSYPLSISNDGSLMLGLITGPNPAQLLLVHTDGSGSRQLTFDPTGVQSIATLSGDGSTVYVVTGDGKLLKIATATGAITQVIGPTAQIISQTGAFVPGSQVRLQGTGLSQKTILATSFPAPDTLGGTQVTLNGQAVPLLSVTPSEIVIQVPWNMPVGPTIVAIQLAGVTPQFVPAPFQTSVDAANPWDLAGPFHQDFSAPVGLYSPAQAGEIVNYYWSGLGPVTPRVADGIPAPPSPLSVLATPLMLISDPTQAPCQIYYQGLAPGLVGIYQLSVQLPAKVYAVNTTPMNPLSSFSLKLQYGPGQTISFSVPYVLPN